MSLVEELKRNRKLKLDNGVFYQIDLPTHNNFEQLYLSLRTKESRLYPDDIVRQLPDVSFNEALRHEWEVRNISLKKLISYLKKSETKKKILEVGCGMGGFQTR
jgi:hypothetical protein